MVETAPRTVLDPYARGEPALTNSWRSLNRLHVVVAVLALVSLVSHWALVWNHPVPDFDTDTIVARAAEVCGQPWIFKGMGDSAHPLGNAVIQQYMCLWEGSSLLTTFHGWALLLIATIAVCAVLLLVAARTTGGLVGVAAALAYLGMSPALRTLSARAEEDWIGLTMFLLVTVLVLGYERADGGLRLRLALIAIATTVLAVWHLQYLMVLAFGLTPWALLALLRPGLVSTTRRKVVGLGLAMAVPSGTVLGLLFGTGYATRVPYQDKFFSIVNPDYWNGIVDWCRDYVAYSSRWLTGWLANDGQQELLFGPPTSWAFVVLGAVALSLVVLLVVSTRDSALIAITFGCLLLPFLFEPHNAERWDPTAIIVALALAHGGWVRRAGPQESTARSEEESTARSEEESTAAPVGAERPRMVAGRP